MGGGGEASVDTEWVESALRGFDVIKDNFGEIIEAGTIVSAISPAAFGTQCAFITPFVAAAQLSAVAAVGAVGGAMAEAVEAAGACSEEYRRVDDESARRWREFRKRLEEGR